MRPSHADIEQVASLFSLLGEPSRLRIVLACREGPLSVGEIGLATGLSQSLTSHHLRLLRTARLLRAERAGKSVRYGLDDDHVRDVVCTMVSHVCDPHEHRAEPARLGLSAEGERDGER